MVQNTATFDAVRSNYLADSPPTVVRLEIAEHFAALTAEQKRYAHHLSRAAFLGTRVTLAQVSPESVPIYDLIVGLHTAVDGDYARLGQQTGVDEADVKEWLNYAAQFLGNCGNYKGFGDSKFIPRISPAQLEKLSSVNKTTSELFVAASTAGGGIYETKDVGLMHLGYPDSGHLSAYYPDSQHITKAEIAAVSDACEKAGLPVENTRLRKTSTKGEFELLIASATDNPPVADRDLGSTDYLELELDGSKGKCKLVFGDYKESMGKIAAEIKNAEQAALNETERKMHEQYGKSFALGSIEAYKESQRWWIKDKKPFVETNIGFVETYRDPHGVRGEWEGFVAMVNLERTKAFGKLVDAASTFIPRLPWDKQFEKDHFLSPDFTSLEVLSFAGSGIPAGINIPNYDDIRQNLGFKNVSLGNVLSAKAPNEAIPFIRPHDDLVYRTNRDPAFEVQVGIHELLGHGTGKLLQETSPGQFNFDHTSPPISPITNKPITTWYKPGQTWSSVFGSIASSYEECRAECVAMALSCEFDILKLFGFGDGSVDLAGRAGDVLYILTHGRPAVEAYLQKLHVYKSTADFQAGKALYDDITSVGPWWADKVRPLVLSKKQPRKVFVQANTRLDETTGEVSLIEYEPSVEGIIRSYVERDV
ncbi:hypothetical protein DV738_g1276, partial [Chaetothyriales sp. CBS 135597]